MKTTRKLLSVLLTLAILVCMAIPAFAAGEGSITINNTITGKTYDAYKIFDVVYNTGKTAFSYTIKEASPWYAIVAAYDATTNTLTLVDPEDTAANYVVVSTTGDFDAPAFAQYLSNELTAVNNDGDDSNDITPNATQNAAADTVNFTGLDLGYYFVDTSAGALCNLTTTKPAAEINEKNFMELDKAQYDTDARTGDEVENFQVGDTAYYKITSAVPSTTGFTTFEYVLTDVMTDGLSYNDDLKVYIAGEEKTVDVDYTKTFVEGTRTITVSIPMLTGTPATGKYDAGAEIVVTYSAQVTEAAVWDGTETYDENNTVSLSYSNDPTDADSKDTSYTDTVKLFTAEVVIDKYAEGDADAKLEGAEFVLTKTVDGTLWYYVYDDVTDVVSWTTVRGDATVVTTTAEGYAHFLGLENGTYALVETKAPAGYNIMEDPQSFTIAGDNANTGNSLKVIQNVANNTGLELPETGGIGTTIFYIVGAALALGAVVLLITKRRMSVQ